MKSHWTIAALLSSTLIVGCNGRGNDTTQNSEQNQAAPAVTAPAAPDQTLAPAPAEPQQQPYATADNSLARTERPRATSGRRDTVEPRSATPSRNDTVPQVGLPARENTRATETSSPAPRAPQWREITLPAGTALPLELTTALSSETSQVEMPVSARLRNAIVVDGDTAIPAGAIVTGTVTDVERSGRVQGRSHLSFAFSEVRMNSGREDLRTNPVTFEGEATKSEDATKVGAGAVGGAILGGILGGKKGAGKGAVIGGAAGTGVVLATRGKDVTLAEGTNVTATLAQPLTLRVPIR